MFRGLLFIRFVEAVVCICKDENIAIYLFIHTIQHFFFSKLAPIFAPIFFLFFFVFCLACSLKN